MDIALSVGAVGGQAISTASKISKFNNAKVILSAGKNDMIRMLPGKFLGKTIAKNMSSKFIRGTLKGAAAQTAGKLTYSYAQGKVGMKDFENSSLSRRVADAIGGGDATINALNRIANQAGSSFDLGIDIYNINAQMYRKFCR